MTKYSCNNTSLNNVLLICKTSTNTEGFIRLFDSNDFSVDIRHENLNDIDFVGMAQLYILLTPLIP